MTLSTRKCQFLCKKKIGRNFFTKCLPKSGFSFFGLDLWKTHRTNAMMVTKWHTLPMTTKMWNTEWNHFFRAPMP